MNPEDYIILIAPRSSAEQIRLKLRGEHPDWLSEALEFLITDNGKVYISHVSSHLQLQRDCRVADCSILSHGSLSVFDGPDRLRPVVRPACCDLSGTPFLREMQKRIAAFVMELR